MPTQIHDMDNLLDQLESAVDDVCSDDPGSIAGATATLMTLARRYPALVKGYQRTLMCVARVRAPRAEGPALSELLGMLGLPREAKI